MVQASEFAWGSRESTVRCGAAQDDVRHEALDDLGERLQRLPRLGQHDIDAVDGDAQRLAANGGRLDLDDQRVDEDALHAKVRHSHQLLHDVLADLCREAQRGSTSTRG